MNRICLIAVLCALVVVGCGQDNKTRRAPPPPSASTVAIAYAAAAFRCGENGAGRQYDLSISPNRDLPRSWYVAYQLDPKNGCHALAVPDLQPIRVMQREDQATVKIVAPTFREQIIALLSLVRIDGHWLVDTSASTTMQVAR